MIADLMARTTRFSFDYEGFKLTGTAEIEPELPPDGISPAEPRSAGILEIFIDGKPAADIINPRVEQWVCEQLEQQHEH